MVSLIRAITNTVGITKSAPTTKMLGGGTTTITTPAGSITTSNDTGKIISTTGKFKGGDGGGNSTSTQPSQPSQPTSQEISQQRSIENPILRNQSLTPQQQFKAIQNQSTQLSQQQYLQGTRREPQWFGNDRGLSISNPSVEVVDARGKFVRKANIEEQESFQKNTGVLQAKEESKLNKFKRQSSESVRPVTNVYNTANKNIADTITKPVFNYLESKGITTNVIARASVGIGNPINIFNTPLAFSKTSSDFSSGMVEGILNDVRDKPLKNIVLYGAGRVVGVGQTYLGLGKGIISKGLGAVYVGQTIYFAGTSGSVSGAGQQVGVGLKDIAILGWGYKSGVKDANTIKTLYKKDPTLTFISIEKGKTISGLSQTDIKFTYGKEKGIARAYSTRVNGKVITLVGGTKGEKVFSFPTAKEKILNENIFGGTIVSKTARGKVNFYKEILPFLKVGKSNKADISIGSGKVFGVQGVKSNKIGVKFPSGKIIKIPQKKYSDLFNDLNIAFGKKDKVVFGFTSAKSNPNLKGYGGIAFGERVPSSTNVNSFSGVAGKKSSPSYIQSLYSNQVVSNVGAIISRTKPFIPKYSPPSKILPSISFSPTQSQSQQERVSSVYAGKGMYERTDGGQMPKSNNLLSLNSVQAFNQNTLLSNKLINIFSTRARNRGSTTQISITTPITKQVPKQTQTPIQTQSQRLRIIPKQPSPTITRIPRIPRIPNPTKKIPLLPPFKFKKGSGSQSQGSFSVFIRRFKKFKPIGFNISKEKAFSLGEFATQRGLSQTFKIEKKGGGSVDFGTPAGYYKKPSKKGVLFIELPTSKINTFSEKNMLSFARKTKGRKRK